jgi:hypothetical protein
MNFVLLAKFPDRCKSNGRREDLDAFLSSEHSTSALTVLTEEQFWKYVIEK